MTQTLSVYDPLFYAQEALIQVEKALGMAGRVYRGYDKNPHQKGSVISIRVPSTFTSQNAPATTANEIIASEVQITLDQWKEVRFALTDKELTYTGEQIITDHIRPAAYALADTIDQALNALYVKIPWVADNSSPCAVGDILSARKILFKNAVPLDDIHLQLGPTQESEFLALAAFSQSSGAGDVGVQTMQRGGLGMKFGFECFANQNVKSHTGGSCSDNAGAVDSGTTGYAIGATTIHCDGLESAGSVKIGDTVVFAGHTQRYAITADATATTGDIDLAIYPALKAAVAEDEVVTVTAGSKTEVGLAFHRNAFALAMAPLSELGGQLGAKIATVSDPRSGLSLRSRMWYDGTNSAVLVGIDVLYGVKCLDPNLACRLQDA